MALRRFGRIRTPQNQPSSAAANHLPINTMTQPEPKHSLIAKLEGPSNPQDGCVFFVCVPAEIRNNIFSLVLYSYDNLLRPYPENAYYSRPGYRYHQRIDTSLLETCRRIYSETHDLPISQNEHVFWCSASRGPFPLCDDPSRYFALFTEEQKEAILQVHFFTQLFWLEGPAFKHACQILNDIRLKNLKITVRHSDWWIWENNAPLTMKSQWAHDNIGLIQGLETLEVELETMERDKTQLERITKSMLSWRINLSPLRALTTEGSSLKSEKYMGQSAFSAGPAHQRCIYYRAANNRWTQGHMPPPPDVQAQLPYIVSTLRWNASVKTERDHQRTLR